MPHTFKPAPALSAAAAINPSNYNALKEQALHTPNAFWGDVAKRLDWIKPFTTVQSGTGFEGNVDIRWFEDGTLNACYNCVDRHLPHNANKTALIFEADEPGHAKHISFAELHRHVCQLANALTSLGIGKGDTVTIYMPMVLEATYAMLACARIGAVHSVVFGGFSPESLASRIVDCQSKLVITANEAVRGGKKVPLKANTDEAVEHLSCVQHVLVLQHTPAPTAMKQGRDIWWHDLVPSQAVTAPYAEMAAEDPMFILYTSGSTGKPKGVLHTTAGYMVYASYTHEVSFDAKPNDIYWCTADVGWITGHSYIVYGPLANGVTSLVFEGTPNYPDFGRFWQVVETHKVSLFYTAPTAIRTLLREGDAWVQKHDRSSLRILGSVGEPINSEAWLWYYNVVGEGKARVVDTYWQTETGGHIISPVPHVHSLKPGSAMQPFFGIDAQLVDNEGHVLEGAAEGNLVITRPWPGIMRSLWGDHERFVQTYFTTFKGKYFTGDGAKRDADGDFWVTGRVDDVLNVSGHRLGTAELESAINLNKYVAESAVVGVPHPIKGQGIYAFVIGKEGVSGSPELTQAIINDVRHHIGPIARIDCLQWVSGLPKTRSGKIMRRILRKVAAGEVDQLGDTSTLADPSVVDALVKGRVTLQTQ